MKTVLYFYESAFMMWRRRLAGIYTIARAEGWHVESIDVGELDHGVRSVLEYWKPSKVAYSGTRGVPRMRSRVKLLSIVMRTHRLSDEITSGCDIIQPMW